MRTLLDEGALDFEGDFYRYTGITTAARPVQEHLPLKVGAMGGPKSMELAGEIADGLHTAGGVLAGGAGVCGGALSGSGSSARCRSISWSWTSATRCSARSRLDGDVARRAGRILAAFYMPLDAPSAARTTTGSNPDAVTSVTDGIRSRRRRARASKPLRTSRRPDRWLPEHRMDWVAWLKEVYIPAGRWHGVSFTDPFTLRAWAGIEVEGLPDLGRAGSTHGWSRFCLRVELVLTVCEAGTVLRREPTRSSTQDGR